MQTRVNNDQNFSPQGILCARHRRMNPIPPNEIIQTGVLVSTGGQCLPIETGAHYMAEEEGEEESGQFDDPSRDERADSSFVVAVVEGGEEEIGIGDGFGEAGGMEVDVALIVGGGGRQGRTAVVDVVVVMWVDG